MARSRKDFDHPMTFRQLVERVAREGKRLDARPRAITSLVKACRMSRPHFYHALRGSKALSDHMVKRIEQGLRRFAPWVTEKIVQEAIDRTRKNLATAALLDS